MSVDSVTPGIISRIRATRSRYSSRVWRRRIAVRTRVDPDCTGRWTCLQTLGRSRIASIRRVAGVSGMRACEPDSLDAGDVVHRRQELRRSRRTDRRAPDSGSRSGRGAESPCGPLATASRTSARMSAFGAHPLVATRVRHHAERAVVVAPLDDRDVRLDRDRRAARCPSGKRHVVPRVDVDFGERRRGGAASTSIGSSFTCCVPEDDVDDVAVRLPQQRLALPAARRSRRR